MKNVDKKRKPEYLREKKVRKKGGGGERDRGYVDKKIYRYIERDMDRERERERERGERE